MALPTQDDLELSKLLLPIQLDDHIQGSPEARFTLVEYGDYECPDCEQLFVTLRNLSSRQANDLRLVFRHYPRSGVHPNAQQAAEAAEAASAQGRFWEMHDLLFQHQSALKTKDLLKYAELLFLDTQRFRNELKHHTYEDRVREDFRRGVANGVYGTLGLFVNGIRYNGALNPESLSRQLQLRAETDVNA